MGNNCGTFESLDKESHVDVAFVQPSHHVEKPIEPDFI